MLLLLLLLPPSAPASASAGVSLLDPERSRRGGSFGRLYQNGRGYTEMGVVILLSLLYGSSMNVPIKFTGFVMYYS